MFFVTHLLHFVTVTGTGFRQTYEADLPLTQTAAIHRVMGPSQHLGIISDLSDSPYKRGVQAGETDGQLGTLAALPEDLGSVPGTHTAAHHHDYCPGGPNDLF